MLLAVALACGPAFGQARPPFADRLAAAAKERPGEPYAGADDAPPDLVAALAARGYPKKPLTNAEVEKLFEALPKAPVRLPTPEEAARRHFADHPPKLGLPDPNGDLSSMFDGSAGHGNPALAAQPPEPKKAQPKKKEGQGLRVFGLELGGGRDEIKEEAEPYLRKGLPQLFDWDISARVALDGLGANVRYRHPTGMRSFKLGFLKYADVPALLGGDHLRDDAYHLVGQTPDKPQGGFELGASGAINAYLGGSTIYDFRQGLQGGRYTDRRELTVETGYSPLGDNPGKSWNVTLLPKLLYQDIAVKDGAYDSRKQGFGFMAGVAFQQALDKFRIPVLQPHPDPNSNFVLDRFKVRLDGGYTVVSPVVDLSAELTFRVLKHLELTGGATLKYWTSPDERDPQARHWDPGAIVGVGLKY